MKKNIKVIIEETRTKAEEATKLEENSFAKLEELLAARRELEEIELQWFFAVDKEGKVAVEDVLMPMAEFGDDSKRALFVAIYETKKQYVDAHNKQDDVLKEELINNFLLLKGLINNLIQNKK